MPVGGVSPVTALTPREREVAALVAEGLSNAEISQRLVISPGTAANHVAYVMRALRARNRVQVVVWVVLRGLYPPRC
jgi:DNA-binding CsgD family transcriptional regulator